MIQDNRPEEESRATYSPPCVIDVDSHGDQEFAVNPAILVSKG